MNNNTDKEQSIFDSFNARSLSAKQVAKTFIAPKCFKQLLEPNNSVLIGPRGSGKTTLLKMLQLEAMEYWRSPLAREYYQNTEFIGVFVPTDIMWTKQLYSLDDGFGNEGLLANAAFTTTIIRALIASMDYRCNAPKESVVSEYNRVSINSNTEARIACEMSSFLNLPVAIQSFDGLQKSLMKRINDIFIIANKERELGGADRAQRLAKHEYLFFDFIRAFKTLTAIFESEAKISHSKWAILVDELELAPDNIREALVHALRSSDHELLFKLSLSPYSPELIAFASPDSPTTDNDYTPIRLWYPNKEENTAFCEELLKSMLIQKGCPEIKPEDVFGQSDFDYIDGYAEGSNKHKHIYSLFQKDLSFSKYIEEKGLDITKLEEIPEDKMASDVRKASPIIILRDFVFSLDKTGMLKKKSLSNYTVYSGVKSLYAIAEGNPRLFIILMTKLLDKYIASGRKRLSPATQYSAINDAVNNYRALLKTIPFQTTVHKKHRLCLLKLLDTIGDFFSNELYAQKFSPDYKGSFKTDEKIDTQILEMLGVALNAGAIIYIPEGEDELILLSLKEAKRFRLSYLLAVEHKLPLTVGKDVSLRRIIKEVNEEIGEASLFDEATRDK